MHRGSSFFGEFTQLETGTASKSGVSGVVRSSTGGSVEASHSSKWAGDRMSGMHSWIGRISSFAWMVTMVKVSMVARLAGFRHASHRPAKAIGALSRRRISVAAREQSVLRLANGGPFGLTVAATGLTIKNWPRAYFMCNLLP